MPAAEVSFNYLGQVDQVVPEGSPFHPARESRGPRQRELAGPRQQGGRG